jgi:hypothetical protein
MMQKKMSTALIPASASVAKIGTKRGRRQLLFELTRRRLKSLLTSATMWPDLNIFAEIRGPEDTQVIHQHLSRRQCGRDVNIPKKSSPGAGKTTPRWM